MTHELLKTRAIPLPEIEAAIRKHGSWEGELVHTRKDGVEIVVSSRWVEKLNLAKELVQVMEINRDITDRKKSELELHESHQALQNRQLELTALMDAVPAQVWISRDRECIHMIGNKAVYDLVGLPAGSNVSESAPIGESPKNFQTYRGGKPVPREELPMQQAARTGNAVRGIDLELRFADGSSKWIYGNAVPLRDAEGTLCGAVAGMIDFTEYKNAFDRLADREHKLRVVFDGITTCLALLTPEGRLLETNRVTLESSNCRREDLLGQLYWNTVWFQSDPGASTLIKEAVQRAAGGEFVNIQAPIVTPAGNKEPFQISFRPILVEHGKVELIVSEARLPSI